MIFFLTFRKILWNSSFHDWRSLSSLKFVLDKRAEGKWDSLPTQSYRELPRRISWYAGSSPVICAISSGELLVHLHWWSRKIFLSWPSHQLPFVLQQNIYQPCCKNIFQSAPTSFLQTDQEKGQSMWGGPNWMLEDHKRPKPVVTGTLLIPVQDRGTIQSKHGGWPISGLDIKTFAVVLLNCQLQLLVQLSYQKHCGVPWWINTYD